MIFSWNQAIEPLREEEIPKPLRKYIMLLSNNLEWQQWKDGQLYCGSKCPVCGIIKGGPVAIARQTFRSYKKRFDTFAIICGDCYSKNITAPYIPTQKYREKREMKGKKEKERRPAT